MEQIEKFTVEFFKNLKCDVSSEGDVLIVENVSKGFEDLFGRPSPYRLSFVSGVEGSEFVGKGSRMMEAMRKFLEGAGEMTLLRIDFDVDPDAEIKKRLNLRNCEVGSLKKGYRNNFFARFSFVTSFNYLNESERLLSEIYVHEGKVVEGDLDGYKTVDGERLVVDKEKVKKGYDVARGFLGELVKEKQEVLGEVLKKRIDVEVKRIEQHYDRQLGELGGDLNLKLTKMKELENDLKFADVDKVEILNKRLERVRRELVKVGDDDAVKRILKEREFTIRDAMQKFSLNIDRKLVNTTVIYYPIYSFRLHLQESGVTDKNVGRFLEMNYDPLTKVFSKLECEGCGNPVVNLSLCAGGHVTCGDCLESCGECGKKFCVKCLNRSCISCGRKLCRDCAVMCRGCGKYVCGAHVRVDCVSGDERCVSCLRACLRCHGMAQERYFGEAADGSKVCMKCLGAEKRGEVLGKGFG